MSAFEATEPRLLETIRVHRVSPHLGFFSVRLPAVHLTGGRIEEAADGTLKFTPPATEGRDGRQWPSWALQPGAREAVEREVSILWARSA